MHRIAVLLATLSIVAIIGCRADNDAFYFHMVEGEIKVTGAINNQVAPAASSVPNGAGSYEPGSDRVGLTFSSSLGSVHAVVNGVSGPSEYPLEELSFFHEAASDTITGYICGLGCDPCIVKLEEVSREQVSGTFSCTGLRSCDREATIPPDEVGDPDCGNLVATTVDMSTSFEMTQPSSGPLDY